MAYLVAARRTARMGILPMLADGTSARIMPLLYRPPYAPSPIPAPPPLSHPVSIGPAVPVIAYPPPTAPAVPAYPSPTPPPAPSQANAGTPVPAGYPTSQIFVDPNGGFWQYSTASNSWVNVGTPYNTGATASVPPVNPGTTPSAPTSLAIPTTAPAPVSTVNIAAPSSTYQDILNWLEEDTLGATIGFSSIPNWIITAGAIALAWKFSHGGKR